MNVPQFASRRRMLIAAATAPLLLAGCGEWRDEEHGEAGEDPPILPVEDLMREHGLLARLLLIYEQALAQSDIPWPTIGNAAHIMRAFIEDFHQKQEEAEVFTRLEHAGRELQLVATLRRQHAVGRLLTEQIAPTATESPARDASRERLTALIRQSVRMNRAHAAREDTVLLPAFREVCSGHEYEELHEAFEAREHALIGRGGFHTCQAQVAQLETSLGIADLATYTPMVS
jgi:hemerythrin-like domain-containing protein